MRIVVIDGQGGRMGSALVERIKAALPEAECLAVGTNSTATAAMLRAGADAGATGENPRAGQCAHGGRDRGAGGHPGGQRALRRGDARHGARHRRKPGAQAPAAGQPLRRVVVGVREQPLGDYIREAVERIRALSAQRQA